MGKVFDLAEVTWRPVRPELARGITGREIAGPDAAGGLTLTLTRVAPGGEFPPHRDRYGHVFHFLAGEGVGILGEETYAIHPGRVVHIPAGEWHGYRNTGDQEMLLLSVNVPGAA